MCMTNVRAVPPQKMEFFKAMRHVRDDIFEGEYVDHEYRVGVRYAAKDTRGTTLVQRVMPTEGYEPGFHGFTNLSDARAICRQIWDTLVVVRVRGTVRTRGTACAGIVDLGVDGVVADDMTILGIVES